MTSANGRTPWPGRQDLQQLVNVWSALDMRRRVVVILGTIAMLSAILGLARMASTPNMTLLYAGLESGPAGEVVSALQQRGVAHEVRGGSIFVDASRRDQLRMTLASDGLPANSGKGYELLDDLSGFGTTSQMFDAAFWRAKEGELARTILSHPSVRTARVHIASTGSNPFRRNVRPTASIAVTTTGGGISRKHARALRFLVASAVTGLEPEDVSLVDSDGGLVEGGEEAPEEVPNDRAAALRDRVARMLEARVGPGNAVVEVNLDIETKSESIRERQIDPESQVAISTDTEERSNTASDKGGDVTVASNLPDGDAGEAEGSASQSNETRERVNYEVSATEREIVLSPGAIKRLSVAVLINGATAPDAAEAPQAKERTDAELESIRDLVKAAVGFDEARGDEITLKALPFEQIEPAGTVAEGSILDHVPFDVMSMIQAAVLALVAIVLGLFVVRPLLMRPRDPGVAQLAPPAFPSDDLAKAGGQVNDLPSLMGEIDENDMIPSAIPLFPGSGSDPDGGEDGPGAARAGDADPVDRLRSLIGERQEETVEILRNWLEGEEEKA